MARLNCLMVRDGGRKVRRENLFEMHRRALVECQAPRSSHSDSATVRACTPEANFECITHRFVVIWNSIDALCSFYYHLHLEGGLAIAKITPRNPAYSTAWLVIVITN